MRSIGLALYAFIAGAAGLAVMTAVGAPTSSLVIQASSLLIGGVGAVVLARGKRPAGRTFAVSVMIVGAILIGLPLLTGPDVEGIWRWLKIGPLLIQPAMIVLPPMIWLYAARPAAAATVGLVMISALLLTLQPDAAGAAALAFGLAACAVVRRRMPDILAATVAVVGLMWAATRTDPLAPVAYVELAAETAFSISPLLGGVAWIALLTLPLPFLLVGPRAVERLVLAGVWIGLVGAAVLGDYPEAIIGYSASLALGWTISLGLAARTPQESA